MSDVQLEAIAYAGQSHRQSLPNGTARGFFLGDGTGVGKGRTIAGVILDSFNNGAKKAVWLSMNDSLANDAKRDITALFGDASLVENFNGGKKAEKSLSRDSAILFVTYGKLKDKYAEENSNFKQIVQWLGKDFNGVIAFDEAHKMGNTEDQKGERGTKKATLTGLSGIELQKSLPQAKIVYSSATGATNVENLLYAERLGLWGESTPFVNGRDFVSKVKAGGIAAMELVARDLKAMGVYASRNISYDDVKYDRLTHKLTKEQRAVYDELARAWQITLQNVNQALEATNQAKDGHRKGQVMGAFWSAQQRFFNQIITSAKLPSLIADMQKQLDAGNSVVVQLTNTNEAQQERELSELIANGRDIEELDLTPVKLLQKYIEHGFPIEQYELFTDEKGNQKSRRAFKADGTPVTNTEMEKQRDALLDRLASIRAADNPLDQIINHFGTSMVAESTGRTRRIVLKDGKKTQENRTKNAKDADIQAFQDGKKRIMVFSEAGGTGKSYHADLTAKNQQHRVHYLLQAGWKADAAVQGFGRTHRSNQASAPTLVLAATDLKGEARFISTIAKRLDQLGALTKGQRQTGGQGLFSAADNFEGKLAGDVLAGFYRDLLSGRTENIKGRDIIRKIGLDKKLTDEYGNFKHAAEDARKVNLFLNRILTLESNEQNAVFEAFAERLQAATEKAMIDGTLDKGLENYKADKTELNEVKDIWEDKLTGAKTKYYSLTAHHKIKPVKFADISTSANNFIGFYKHKVTGNVRAVFRTASVTDERGNITDNYRLSGQVKNEYIPQHRLYNWQEIKADEAETLWKDELQKLPEFSKENLHLISGAVLPVWDKLPTENVRIYRVLVDGEPLIGRVIPDNMVDGTLKQLGASRTKEAVKTEDLIKGVKSGDSVYLDNGWRIVQRRVSNENRIEIVGPDYRHNDILAKKGVFTERIQYQTRYFVPAEKDTVNILDEVLKISPYSRSESVAFSLDIDGGDNSLTQRRHSIDFKEFSDAVIEPLGIGVEIYYGNSTINGYFDRANNRIFINGNSKKSPLITAGHELYHILPEEMRRGLAMFFRSQAKTDTPEFKAYKEKAMAVYQKIYDENGMGKFTERDFWEEFTADNCETLFTNESFVKKLTGKSKSLSQKIIDFIRKLLKRLFGKSQYTNSTATEAAGLTAKTLVQAEKMYANALKIKSWNVSQSIADGILQVSEREAVIDNVGYGESIYDAIGFERGEETENSDIKFSINMDESSLTPERMREIRGQFDKDRTDVKKPSAKEIWGERFEWVTHNMTRVFPDISERGEKGTFYAEFRKMMIQWNALPKTASFMTQDKLNKMTKGLSKQEFRTFSELVYFLDLQEEAKLQEERGYGEIRLPNGIEPHEVNAVVKTVKEEASSKVIEALEKRKNIWNGLKEQYIALNQSVGFDVSGRFERENYYHHQVISHMNSKKKRGDGNHHIEINAGRGWLKERKGSTEAINTDFLAVEYKSILQMQYDIYIADALNKIKEQYDIKPELEKQAFTANKKLLDDMITAEAVKNGSDGAPAMVSKGGRIEPDSEIYRRQKQFNRQIMSGFDGLFELAKMGALTDLDGEYSHVVAALKKEDLAAAGLYKYIGTLAGIEIDGETGDYAMKQAVISARTVMKYTSQKKAWIKSALGKKYQTWESIAKDSEIHSIFQPRRGNYFYTKEVTDEDAFNKAFNDIVNGLIQGESAEITADAKKLFEQYSETVRLMGADYEQWVLPNEIITTMNKVANPKQAGAAVKAIRELTTAWKGWSTSINPLRTVKFGIRNLFGDLDAVIAGNPLILKHSPRAVKEIYAAMRHKNYSPEFMEWTERGGYSSMIFANEMDSEMQDKLFKHLREKQGKNILDIPGNIFKGYMNGVETAHNFREAVLRYSAYLYFKDNLNKNDGNVKNYTASNRFIVRGLQTTEDKAYQLSKDLLGAYDEVSMMGQTLRNYLIPFYSFTETNMKRYTRIFANIIASDSDIPEKVAKVMLKTLLVNLIGLLFLAWNKFVKGEDEEKLPPSVRERPHITLGSIDDNVYAFTRLGSFSELLEWFGFDDLKLGKDDLLAPADKAWGMITPFVKMPAELMSGINFYPQLSKPRAVRDKWEHFFNSLGVADIYHYAAGKPTQGIGEILERGLIYKYDYKQSAYWEIMDRKREFQNNKTNAIYMPDDKSNALYYMKLAVRYKDKTAAKKYLEQYFENGGTGKGVAQSFDALNPMYGFTGKETMAKGQEFMKWLTDNERAKLAIAQKYYEHELMLPENVMQLLRKKDITNDEAKNLLAKFINAKAN